MAALHPDLYETLIVLDEIGIHEPVLTTLIRRITDIEWNTDVGRTASVRSVPETGGIILQIAPPFWETLNRYQRAFVVAHEMMHVILNHMGRFKEFRPKHPNLSEQSLAKVSNIAQDLIINESLLDVGFKLEYLGDLAENAIWWHTMLPSVRKLIDEAVEEEKLNQMAGEMAYRFFQRRGQDYEYYAWWMIKLGKLIPQNEENPAESLQGGGKTIETPEDFEDFLKNTNAEEVAEAVAKAIGEAILEGDTELEAEMAQGYSDDPRLVDAEGGGRTILPSKKKLRSLVKSDFNSQMQNAVSTAMNYATDPTFAREERKYHALPKSYRLPSLVTPTIEIDFQIYIDVSGSVAEYTQQFVDSSLSVIEAVTATKPEVTVRNIDYFIFATGVRNVTEEVVTGSEIDLNVGWGTSFTAIWDNFEEIGNMDAYVYIITDGYGNGSELVTPEQWYWLIFDEGIYAQDFNEVMKRIEHYLPKNAKAFPFNTVPE